MEHLPQYDKIKFKAKFVERYSALTDWKKFSEISLSWLRKSIRINTLKISVKDCVKRLEKKGWELKQIPWCKEGFWISGGRYDIGNLIEHTLGYIYVQESASMIPPIVLNPKPGDYVLDMCASPGSKTSQIAMYMKNEGTLIANEVMGRRIAPLGLNLQRCGVSNAVISKMAGERFHGHKFDKILVDAPCSGTGTIRKSLRTIKTWNPGMVKSIAGLQFKLLKNAYDNLKIGGTIVYSTCTLEPEENEGVVNRLIENCNVKLMDIKFNGVRSESITSFGTKEYDKQVIKCLRIWPQDNDSEGFFVAKIKKVGVE